VNYDGEIRKEDYTAIVIASELRRTGHFDCSHAMIAKLHENVVWGMRGNFVSLPTDCPQRDERLGWTGDIQVFAKTANYLFDTYSFLDGWLKDVAAEQVKYDGVPPIFVPWTPPPKDAVNPLGGHKPKPHGVWADVVAITPWDLYQAFGDDTILEQQFDSMVLWLEKGVPKLPNGMWDGTRAQYGDWLDPKAPPQYPAHGRTDYLLPANAYLVSTTGLVAKIASRLGRSEAAAHYEREHHRLRELFRDEYITKNGRISSDTQTALTLALWFDLVNEDQRQHTAERLEWLIKWDYFKISTGFAGTPLILPNLAKHGKLHLAYRMLQEQDNPSWLYSVGMGATTIVSENLVYPLIFSVGTMGQYAARWVRQSRSNDFFQPLRPWVGSSIPAQYCRWSIPIGARLEEGFGQTSAWRHTHFCQDLFRFALRFVCGLLGAAGSSFVCRCKNSP
jgi:alpha-L-rhamnosidase